MLTFDKAQSSNGIDIDFNKMTESEAIAALRKLNNSLPTHPRELNLGCGPEPEGIDIVAATHAARCLVHSPGQVSAAIHFAKDTGAWFYWTYSVRLLAKELRAQFGIDGADDIIYNDDRQNYNDLRAEKMRWVFKERFGIEL